MCFKVAIHLAGGTLNGLRLGTLGKPQHINLSVHASVGDLHWVELAANGQRWTGKHRSRLLKI